MLKKLFPARYTYYLSLPVLGPMLNELVIFMTNKGYSNGTIRNYIPALVTIDEHFQQLKYQSIEAHSLSAMLFLENIGYNSL